jgi:hypothetical protein
MAEASRNRTTAQDRKAGLLSKILASIIRPSLPGAKGKPDNGRNFAQPQWRYIDPQRVSARRLKWDGGRRAEGNSVDGETAGEPKMGRGTTGSPKQKKGAATA